MNINELVLNSGHYTDHQKQVIEIGLNHGVDVAAILNPAFEVDRMRIILKGLLFGVCLSHDDMSNLSLQFLKYRIAEAIDKTNGDTPILDQLHPNICKMTLDRKKVIASAIISGYKINQLYDPEVSDEELLRLVMIYKYNTNEAKRLVSMQKKKGYLL